MGIKEDVTQYVFTVNEKRFLSLSKVNVVENIGKPRQTCCSEMLHWDELRQQRGINDGTPSMMETFDPHNTEYFTPQTFYDEGLKCLGKSIVLRKEWMGQKKQTYCAEMLHWDELCFMRREKANEPTMAARFKPFARTEWFIYDNVEQKITTHIRSSVAQLHAGEKTQNFCCEMQHWDDFVQAKTNEYPNPSMRVLFAT